MPKLPIMLQKTWYATSNFPLTKSYIAYYQQYKRLDEFYHSNFSKIILEIQGFRAIGVSNAGKNKIS
jgi:hypothetical protein